jgi:hypothetical protein
MDSSHKLNVAEWIDTSNPPSATYSSARRHVSPCVIGLIGTLLLHALGIHFALSGIRAHRFRSPDNPILGSTPEKSDVAPSDTLVLIELPTLSKTDSDLTEERAAATATAKETLIAVIRPDPPTMMDIGALQIETNQEQGSQTSIDNGNGAELARLFGIYSGQIQARVERIWRRPRTPVNEGAAGSKLSARTEYFRCQVQIVQDFVGNVQEILLPNCNGSFAWQSSLVTAIRQSSPLPAPPNPTVFSHSITLEFNGYPYGAGGTDEDYEIASGRATQSPN